MPSQLETLPPAQAALLIKKKRFWKRTMWISLAASVILALAAIGGVAIRMISAFSELNSKGAADPSELAGDISVAILTGLWSLPPAILAFLVFLISLIRCLSLPKLPKK